MAKVKRAELMTSGQGQALMMVVDVELDWDRGDDRTDWEVQIRFMGADVGGDELVLAHAVPVRPADGDRRRIEVAGASGVFDEDRGDDEVHAEVSVVPRVTDIHVVKTNTVKGDFEV